MEKNDFENTIYVSENQQFNVLRRCFMSFSGGGGGGGGGGEMKKKSLNFQAMAPSKMSAPPPMVENAQCEIIFRDEKLLIRPFSQVI